MGATGRIRQGESGRDVGDRAWPCRQGVTLYIIYYRARHDVEIEGRAPARRGFGDWTWDIGRVMRGFNWRGSGR